MSVAKWVLCIIFGVSLSVLAISANYNSSVKNSGETNKYVIDFSQTSLDDINDIGDKIEFTELNDTEKRQLFDLFLSSFQKSYNSTETEVRFATFKRNLKLVDKRNKAETANGGSAIHGITKFSDLSEEEFKSQFLTAIATEERSATPVDVLPYAGDEDVVSWIGIYTADVIDQGYCGSCWAFSVTQQMQADGIRLGIYDFNISLSAQQITSCDLTSFGCAGGWTERAYEYIKSTGGLALEKDYPYTSYYDVTGQCMSDPSTYYVTIDGYYLVKSEQAMIDYVKSTGPLSICVDATEWASYVKGVVSVCGSDVDHCVQIVAVDTSASNGYWQVCCCII